LFCHVRNTLLMLEYTKFVGIIMSRFKVEVDKFQFLYSTSYRVKSLLSPLHTKTTTMKHYRSMSFLVNARPNNLPDPETTLIIRTQSSKLQSMIWVKKKQILIVGIITFFCLIPVNIIAFVRLLNR
jgi:hypothetical protein